MRIQVDEALIGGMRPQPRRRLVLILGSLVLIAACIGDSAQDPVVPVSAPVLTTAPSEFTTTTTTLPPGPKLYGIQEGDTLTGVAAEHGITLEQLLGANPGITDPSLIKIGDQILIPDIPDPTEPGLTVPEPDEPELPALTPSTTTTEPNLTTSTAGG